MSAKRRPFRARTGLAVMAALLPVAHAQAAVDLPAWLGSFVLGSWSGDLGLSYANSAQSSSLANGLSAAGNSQALTESMRIGNSGFYIFSPLLFQGNLALDLQRRQDQSDAGGGAASQQANMVGYSFSASILDRSPYAVALSANHHQFRNLHSLGGVVEGTNAVRGASLRVSQNSVVNDWGYPWFEANLGISATSYQSVATSFGRSQVTDEEKQTLSFDANKGFETADLRLNYQLNDWRNAVFSQGNVQSNAAKIVYDLDFGTGLNKRLVSALGMSMVSGAFSSTSISSNQSLHIDHYANLSTDYRYGLDHLSTEGRSSTIQNGTIDVSHQLYKNLNTSVGVNVSQTSLPNGALSSYGTHVRQSYNHSLPGNEKLKGRLAANWSGGYQSASNDLSSPYIAVNDEPHVATAPLIARTGFLLNQTRVLTAGIQLWSVKNGGRIPLVDATRAPPGSGDYEVVVEGDRTRIILLPTSLLLVDNDPLVASYSYEIAQKLQLSTAWTGFGMRVNYDYGWVSASLSHQQSTQPLTQASGQFLQSTLTDALEIGLTGVVKGMPANASMNWQSSRATGTASNSSSYHAGLTWYGEADLRVTLDVDALDARFTLPDQHSFALNSARSSLNWPNTSLTLGLSSNKSSYSGPLARSNSSLTAQSALNWFTQSGWTHSVAIDRSSYTAQPLPDESLVRIIAKSSAKFGKLSLDVSLGFGQWNRSANRALNRSFQVGVVRQF